MINKFTTSCAILITVMSAAKSCNDIEIFHPSIEVFLAIFWLIYLIEFIRSDRS